MSGNIYRDMGHSVLQPLYPPVSYIDTTVLTTHWYTSVTALTAEGKHNQCVEQ